METFVLKAEKREKTGSNQVHELREEGIIPSVVYGRGYDSVSISVKNNEFTKVYDRAGESTLIDLTLGDETYKVLVAEVQREPVSDKIVHVDLQRVRMDEEIQTEIEINFIGESRAVKELGGTLVTSRHSLDVKCLPGDLVSKIDADLSQLKTFDDVIRISDLNIPEGIKVHGEDHLSVAVVIPPRTEEEMAALDEAPEENVEGVEAEGEEKKEGEDAEGEDKQAEEKEEDKKE